MKTTNSRSLWQLIFIMCILYAVSSMNVLIIFRSILPFLPPGFYLETMVLKYFALVSFGLAIFLSSYHLFITFNKVERSIQSDIAMKWINRISKVLHIVIGFYALYSIYVLFWGLLGIIPPLPGADEGAMWILYAILSFLVVICFAVFYFSVYFLMGKKIDK